jgi:nucleoid DNA-binding protein
MIVQSNISAAQFLLNVQRIYTDYNFYLAPKQYRVKKFDTLISSYLYTNKKMDIEGFGTFSLDENFVLPPDAEKSTFFPLEGIHFNHNTRAETSTELIDFLVQQTGKIRSLVKADFSSYVSEIKQFVNIGKAWAIEGIGTLQKNREGKFELIPGEALAERVNMHYTDAAEGDDEPVKRRKWMVGFILTLAIIAVLAGLGFGVYVLFIKTQDHSAVTDQTNNQVFTQSDTPAVTPGDTITQSRPDSIPAVPPGTVNYKAYFKTTRFRSSALTIVDGLSKKGVPSQFDSLVIRDTLRYRLFIFQQILPADSAKVKDSLATFFGGRVRLERSQ